MSLYNNVEQFALDVALAHRIIHGDENTLVETEGGPVDSFAKLMAALRAMPVPAPVQPVNASRALMLADASQYLTVDSEAAVILTLPAQATAAWADNTVIHIHQIGNGQVIIDASAVAIITEETLKTRKKGSLVTLKRLGPDLWALSGSLEPSVGALEFVILPAYPSEPFPGIAIAGFEINDTGQLVAAPERINGVAVAVEMVAMMVDTSTEIPVHSFGIFGTSATPLAEGNYIVSAPGFDDVPATLIPDGTGWTIDTGPIPGAIALWEEGEKITVMLTPVDQP